MCSVLSFIQCVVGFVCVKTLSVSQEAFDYIGSSKMVFDMQRNEFVMDLNNVHSMLEIGQVCEHTAE